MNKGNVKPVTTNNVTAINKAKKTAPSGSVEIKGSSIKQTPSTIKQTKNLSADEAAYLDYYKGDGFYDNNEVLRNKSSYSSEQVKAAETMNDSLDSAIDKFATDGDMTVYRGLRGSDAFNAFDDSSVGGVISLDTVQSTTSDAKVALNYSGAMKVGDDYYSPDGGSVIFKINVKGGTHALDLDAASGINTTEKEILLSSKGSYTVKSVENRTDASGNVTAKIINVDYEG